MTCELSVLLKQDHMNVQREYDRSTAFFNASSEAQRLDVSIKTHFGRLQDDDLFTTARELCKQLDAGVTTVVLPSDSLSSAALWALFGNTNVPRISTSVQQRCGSSEGDAVDDELASNSTVLPDTQPVQEALNEDSREEEVPFGVSMMIDLSPAVLDIAEYFQFNSLIFLYDSDHALLKLQGLANSESHHVTFRHARRISTASEAQTLLREIEEDDPYGRKLVVIDCYFQITKDIIVAHVRDLFMGRRNYNYLLLHPVVSEKYFEGIPEFAALNVTAFRFHVSQDEGLRNVFHKMTAEEASLVDASTLVTETYKALRSDPPPKNSDLFEQRVRPKSFRGESCGKVTYLTNQQGRVIDTYLKKISFQGKTGNVQFDAMGCRVNFTVDVIQVNRKKQWKEIGQWTEGVGFVPREATRPSNITAKKDVYLVTTILEDPYLMFKSYSPEEETNQTSRYEGFCLDLMEAISRLTGIKYRLYVVKDGKYGSLSADGWDGIIGEVIRGEADIALGGLTITSARKNVVDFTHPFLSTGIAGLAKRPPSLLKKGFGTYTFSFPFHLDLWIGVASSLGAVVMFLFLFGVCVMKRDYCCQNSEEDDQSGSAVLKTFCDSLEMIAPHASSSFLARSISGRILSTSWWIFIILIFSAYTVHLAPFLALRDVSMLGSLDDLSQQKDIKFGTLRHGHIREHFEKATQGTNKRIWDVMKSDQSVPVYSRQEGVQRVRRSDGSYVFLTESLFAEYVSGRRPCDTWTLGKRFSTHYFALAVQLGSPLRDTLNEAIASLSETGELEDMKKKWWTSECATPPEDIPLDAKVSFPLLFCLGCIIVAGITVSLFEIISRTCVRCQRLKVAQGPPTVAVSYESEMPLKTIA